jgi:hypothetical protein
LADAARFWQSPPTCWQLRQEPWQKLKPLQQQVARLGVHGLAQAALPAHRQQQSRQRMMPEPDLTPNLMPNLAPE